MNFLNKIVDSIDDSRIVKKAYMVLYYILGILLGGTTILCSVCIYNWITSSELFEFKTWSKTVFILLFTVYTAILIVSGVVTFLYWKKHGDAIGSTKSKYPNNLALADLIQTMNNSYVFASLSAIVSAVVLLYVGLILTGELQFYKDGKAFWIATGILVGVIIAYVILYMLMTMLVSFVTEKIKQSIQISDDLSDVADVMRSAQVIKDADNAPTPEPRVCTECGSQIPPNTATCPNCGCPANN